MFLILYLIHLRGNLCTINCIHLKSTAEWVWTYSYESSQTRYRTFPFSLSTPPCIFAVILAFVPICRQPAICCLAPQTDELTFLFSSVLSCSVQYILCVCLFHATEWFWESPRLLCVPFVAEWYSITWTIYPCIC